LYGYPSSGLLRLSDLGQPGFGAVLSSAEDVVAHPGHYAHALAGRTVASLYEKPSTRTRASTAVAALGLGMNHIELPAAELQMSRGETLADTARTLSEYVDVLVFRTYEQDRLVEFAASATVPVINALTNSDHPCQALADVLTLRQEYGSLSDLGVAFIGDTSGNIGRSFLEAAALTGMTVRVACPDRYRPDEEFKAVLNRLCEASGAAVHWGTDISEAVRGASAVYPEVWVPMDQEDRRPQRMADLRDYRVDASVMKLAAPDAVFMHALPANRGQEVSAAVIDGSQSVVWQQAANRVPACQAVLLHLCGAGPSGDWTEDGVPAIHVGQAPSRPGRKR
jgi:ornithine carbamoyltransferase